MNIINNNFYISITNKINIKEKKIDWINNKQVNYYNIL